MKQNEKNPRLIEIIFENRNKAYGAYELRSNYHSRLNKSFLITLSVMISFAIAVCFLKKEVKVLTDNHVIDKVDMSKTFTVKSYDLIDEKKLQPVNRSTVKFSPKNIDPASYQLMKDSSIVETKADTAESSVIGDTLAASTTGNSDHKTGSSSNIEDHNTNGPVSGASVDKLPEFPGGMEMFYRFLRNKIHYTAEAKEAKLSGKIFISFVIDENGMIAQIRFLNGIGFGLEESVKEVLKSSPPWTPGLVRNKAVKTEMILPVSFSLR